MSLVARDFIRRAYQVVSANSPTVPLHGTDQSDGLYYLNQLMNQYGGNGLMLTVPKHFEIPIVADENVITFADVGAYGRLSEIISCWLELEGTVYELIPMLASTFENSYRYGPLKGLPLYVIYTQNDASSQLQLYPSPSQGYNFNIRGKFSLQELTSSDDLSTLPAYYLRFLRLALAKEIAIGKSRQAAWTPFLENEYVAAKKEMVAASPINLTIQPTQDVGLWGANRVKAGI